MKSETGTPATAGKTRNLLDLQDGETGRIRSNRDRKSAEMGLFAGVRVTMFRNRKSEHSVVVGAGDARFLVSRPIAEHIELA
ncbi:MAG TPA: FeoA family protein [Kiritimatiellia bacterium]|jgi:Fe2+ transport system protein FeoA|nr:FeoA family protein [Kiritimatiellia bacterium]HOM59373.1 FeoA family protein [Kiritimatiellia bacterium]HOR97421.1 FeoA family protein [Kiritimatiellia bacterium]HPC49421.1 FeoA family protein [Kiritimatiellia bacterium]HPK37896.1 FeoA family protein [Kiritimatiellia bacterium]